MDWRNLHVEHDPAEQEWLQFLADHRLLRLVVWLSYFGGLIILILAVIAFETQHG